jgi:cellulose synthase/poly-beta-1,6-N-acetylglucosamine synthase-like glycosyltransferase
MTTIRETTSVVVPSYRRPDALLECLAGIARQNPPPSEIICVVRDEDRDTHDALSQLTLSIPLCVLASPRPGLVAALESGLAVAKSSIVAFVDDDAVPRPGWLDGIQKHFARDSRVVAVGGRDWVHYDGLIDQPRSRLPGLSRSSRRGPKVGMLEWTGRVTDSHHGGIGPARDVDVLKGANMAFWGDALRSVGFDPYLRGLGAQAHNEIWPCLALRKRGFRIVYDPAVAVDHYVQPRFVGDERGSVSTTAIADATFNETRAVLNYRSSGGRLLTLLWGLIVGTAMSPGVIHSAYQALRGAPGAHQRFNAAARARVEAYRLMVDDSRGGQC